MSVLELNIGDLLGLLESPQEEVCKEVRSLLKETFSAVREPWLVSGLLEYFYTSNSGRLLDLLVGVSEPHDRHLLDRIMEGLRGADRFRHAYILLYAVRRQSPPNWLRKFLHHGAMRELINLLNTGEDVPVLVVAVVVLVLLLPTHPLEIGKYHLQPIMEVFCRLVRWTPKRDQDEDFQPFLQVAVYSLFHRLYALYPCHFLKYLRISFSKPNSARCFFSTLKPMMEKVRLHPLLVTESKESEVAKNRWLGLETHQLILECAKLCLDPSEATCEDVCGSFVNSRGGLTFDALPVPTNWLLYAEENNFWSPSLALSNPSAPSSVRGSSSSVPHTPLFPITTPTLKPTGRVAESPPEAAIEATPETTPFTSPIKMDSTNSSLMGRRVPTTAVCALSLNTVVARDTQQHQQGDLDVCPSPLSPPRKEPSPFKFPDEQCQGIFQRAEKSSLLQSKLKQILKERQQTLKDDDGKVDGCEPKEASVKEANVKDVSIRETSVIESSLKKSSVKDSFFNTRRENKGRETSKREVKDSKVQESSSALLGQKNLNSEKQEYCNVESELDSKTSQVGNGHRRRKVSVYDGTRNVDLEQFGVASEKLSDAQDLELISEETKTGENEEVDKNYKAHFVMDYRISEEKESESSDSRRSSDETHPPCDKESSSSDDSETLGLGIPNQRSMTDLVKNMKTMRLRFLSQCGPPPDLSQYNLPGLMRVVTKQSIPPSVAIKKSSSCPDLAGEETLHGGVIAEARVRKESAVSSLTLSPIRQAVVTSEATTQTEETTIVNPYEQLLDVLMSSPNNGRHTKTTDNSTNDSTDSSPSPHDLLNHYLQLSSKTGNVCKSMLWQQTVNSGSQYDALKNQVRLMQVLLLIERHKREVHAERNRRLLDRAKRVYALEEQQLGLQESVAQLEDEVQNLKLDLQNSHMNAAAREQQLHSQLNQQQVKMSQVLVERDDAKEQRDMLKEQCNSLLKVNSGLTSQIHKTQTHLLEKDRQLNVHSRLSNDNNTLRDQVDILHKQVVLMGEIQDQYKQEVWKLTMAGGGPGAKIGLEQERAAARQQMEELEEKCRISSANLDAALYRVCELEKDATEKTRLVEDQLKAVTTMRDIGAEQCRGVEVRCQSLITLNQILETTVLERNDRIDRLVRLVRRSQRGKSVGSDGVDIDVDLSVSPPSSSVVNNVQVSTSSPPEPPIGLQNTPGSLVVQQASVLNRLDSLIEGDAEFDASARRKT